MLEHNFLWRPANVEAESEEVMDVYGSPAPPIYAEKSKRVRLRRKVDVIER